MTFKKGKYNYVNYLIFTQVYEIFDAETPAQKANEEIDLINILIRDLIDMGFDVNQVYEKRSDEKIPHFKSIVKKYENKWKDILDSIEEEERDNNANADSKK